MPLDEVKSVVLNSDGKFLDRLFPALISAAIAVCGMAVLFWADSRASDRETAAAISQLNRDMATVKEEAKEQRQSAAADRQKIAELAGDVRSVLRSTSRIEVLMDRMNAPPGAQPR